MFQALRKENMHLKGIEDALASAVNLGTVISGSETYARMLVARMYFDGVSVTEELIEALKPGVDLSRAHIEWTEAVAKAKIAGKTIDAEWFPVSWTNWNSADDNNIKNNAAAEAFASAVGPSIQHIGGKKAYLIGLAMNAYNNFSRPAEGPDEECIFSEWTGRQVFGPQGE